MAAAPAPSDPAAMAITSLVSEASLTALRRNRGSGRAVADRTAAATTAVAAPLAKRLADALVRPGVYWLFHSWRLFGYGFILPPLLALRPVKTLLGLLAYGAVHRQRWWQVAVHKALGYGASRRHRIVNPSRHLIRDDKRYLWSLHPHSILADGWHSVVARNVDAFDDEGNGPPTIGRKIALCFAPVIQHVPVHQEMYRDKCGAADKASLVRWWNTPDTDPALIPGGFAEAVFADAGERRYEYAYIKDRKGFVKICIEEGKDIVPCYTFKSTWMYHNPGFLRGLRARLSQKLSIGLVAIIGRMGTSMPLTDDTTTVVFPPFEASRYKVAQLDEAHGAYMEHLETHFDLNKSKYGMDGVQLVFVGRDFKDDDSVARALRRIGILSRQVVKSSEEGQSQRSSRGA